MKLAVLLVFSLTSCKGTDASQMKSNVGENQPETVDGVYTTIEMHRAEGYHNAHSCAGIRHAEASFQSPYDFEFKIVQKFNCNGKEYVLTSHKVPFGFQGEGSEEQAAYETKDIVLRTDFRNGTYMQQNGERAKGYMSKATCRDLRGASATYQSSIDFDFNVISSFYCDGKKYIVTSHRSPIGYDNAGQAVVTTYEESSVSLRN